MRRPPDDLRSPAVRGPARAAFLVLVLTGSAAASDGAKQHPADEAGPTSPSPSNPDHARRPRIAGPSWLRGDPGEARSSGLDGGWTGMACLALVLAACGGLAVAARRLGPRATAGGVQVVGRVALSPKHSVYLLRVGQRVLVLGAGPQGPPALITEMDELPQGPPAPRQEVGS